MNQIKALIYCRVSSERQKNEGHGLDSQEHRCRSLAEANGWLVERVFLDTFTGGGDFLQRPAMRELLAYVDGKPHQQYVVIFDDLKRFARDTIFHWNLRSAFKARNVIPKCLNYNFDDSPEGVFVETIFAAQNQLEREQNRRQVIQKQKARLENGYWAFYPPPGYVTKKDAIHGKLLTPTDRAPIIKEAFEGYASNRFKDQVDVLKFLRDEDFGNGRTLYLEVVRRIFERVIYAGYIEYPEWDVLRRMGHHEAIITLDIYNKVRAKLDGNSRSFIRKDNNLDFPLRGPVLCNVCEKPLTASWTTKKNKNYRSAYYRCNYSGCRIKNKSIRKDVIEDRFSELLKRAKPKMEVLDYAEALFLQCWENKMKDFSNMTEKKKVEIEKVIEEKEVLIRKIVTVSDVVAKEFEKKIEYLANKESQLEAEMIGLGSNSSSFGTALGEVLEYIGNPHDKWENGAPNDKRLVMKLVFTDRIRYDIENGFETAKFSLPMKAFELLAASESQGVEMAGLNPRPKFFQNDIY
ncbi:MAG: Resolvase-like protein [Parcubacteria group bacterium GW2011_GWC1_39_29]|nr:MAG: Resolvase-like protein [Parcubacteria group bacterium GW2011_GWC1_39_29]